MSKPTAKMTPSQKQLREAFDRGIAHGREDALEDVLFELHTENIMLFSKLRDAEYQLARR